MIRLCFLLSLTVLFSLGGKADIGAPVIDEFQRTQFGSQGLGWSAAQLIDGRMVFGFDSISLYDGSRWKTQEVPGTYALRGLDAGPDGRIWVGGVNEIGFLEPDGAGFRYHSLIPLLPAEMKGQIGDIWHVFSDGPGQALFVSTEYLLQWTGDKFAVIHLPGAPRLAAWRDNGRILIGHRPTGVRAMGKEGLEDIVSRDQLHGAGVVWSGLIGGRTVYATTSGLRVMTGGALLPFAPILDSWIQENVLTCATRLNDGGIALGTLKGGITLLGADGAVVRTLDMGEEFHADAVHALFADKDGWLWVVSPARLFRVLSEKGISIFIPPRSAAFSAQAIAPFGNGAIVASEADLWTTLDAPGPDAKRLSKLHGIHERMLSLLKDGPNVLVAHRGGVSLVQPNGTVKLVHAFPSDVFALARAPQGELLAAFNHRVLLITPSDVTEVPGILPDVPTSLVTLADGTLVAGTWAQGIASIGTSPLGLKEITDALAHEPGPTFVALADGALFAARGRKVTAFSLPTGQGLSFLLPEGSEPKAIAHGAGSEAWLASDRQFPDGVRLPLLYHLRVAADRIEATPLRIDPLNHVGSLRAVAVKETEQGPILWIGGDSAMLRVVPADLPPWTPPAAPHSLLLTGTLRNDKELVLPYRQNRLNLEIFSPEPNRRSGLRLQTMIEGTGETWSAPHDRYGVELANLQSGKYRVRARLIAPDDSTSAVSDFALTVAPPWWFTPWALAVEGLLVAILVFGIVRLRVRALRARARLLEKLVAERTAQLAHASQAKSEFVSNMSHELRNPLNGIVASARALDESGMPKEQQKLLATVRHCAGLLDALIGDVLDMAEIESGTIKLRNRDYDPTEIATSAASIVRPIAERKGLRLTVETDGPVPTSAHGDSIRIQQILLNLLGNAIKFSDQGEIKLTLRATVSSNSTPQLHFLVRDEGPGIAPEDRQRLFSKFSRLPAAREKGVPGTGLGLALCRELVERMGGHIDIVDTDGSGSVFHFCVPVRAAGETSASIQLSNTFSSPKSALVVEDLDYNAQAMVAVLKMIQCRAEIAPTAALALDKLGQASFDVVFVDLDLPDMTGAELASAIVAQHRPGKPPPFLVAATAYADEATRERCAKAGMNAFMVKPVTPEKIRSALSSPETTPLAPSHAVAPAASHRPSTIATGGLDLRQMKLLGDKPAEINEAARRLSEMLKADMALLRTSCRSGDAAATRSTAHRIVSHAKFVGAKSLALVAGEMERSALEEPETAVELLPNAEDQAQRLISALELMTR